MTVTPTDSTRFWRRRRLVAAALVVCIVAAIAMWRAEREGSSPPNAQAELTGTTPSATAFRVANLDVGGGDDRSARTKRISAAVSLLQRSKVQIAGFQGLSPIQQTTFDQLTGTTWTTYPGTAYGRNALSSSIAWNADTWTLVTANTFQVPNQDGVASRRPYVLLRNLETGRQTYVVNIDNPTDRTLAAQATTTEINLVNQLTATGTPVLLTGGMNSTTTYFCALTRATTLLAANGGTTTPDTCTPPKNPLTDWIFATPSITLSNYTPLTSILAAQASDRPTIIADALIAAAQD